MVQGWKCEICGEFYFTQGEAEDCERNHPELLEATSLHTEFSYEGAIISITTARQTYRFHLPIDRFAVNERY